MATRPFINFGVDKLETLVGERSGDRHFLDKLLNELSYRSTKRAKRLEERVKRKLRELRVPPTRGTSTYARPPGPTPAPDSTRQQSESRSESEASKSATPSAPTSTVTGAPWQSRSRPPVTNSAAEIISTWIAQEVLSPHTYRRPEDLIAGDRRHVCDFSGRGLPWEGSGERARPKTRLYYHLVLGSISMSEATQSLLEVYADSRPEPPSFQARRAAIGIVTVDNAGRPAEADGVVLSSFAWGLAIAREGDLRRLNDWPKQEQLLVQQLHARLVRRNDNNEILPLTKDQILSAYAWLCDTLALDAGEVEAPRYALRVYQWYVLRERPEPPILNSFFLGDLAKAEEEVAEKTANRSLRQFLAIDPPPARIDLLQVQSALADAVLPGKTPPGRWPSQGRFPLVLLQQAAINIALTELDEGGIAGINGPPGTGKTTLLRDLVAALIVRRAEAMAAFDDPQSAFSHEGKMKVGQAFVHMYSLASNLRGCEMLVASSNNKAVENISKELPGLDAIDSELPPPRYFRTTSDALAGGPDTTWGLIAAVLGNKANRSSFRRAFWQDEDTGLKSYLKVAAGLTVGIADPKNPNAKPRKPAIVQNEKPPRSHDEALVRWRKARKRFKAVLETSHRGLAILEQAHRDLQQLPTLEQVRDEAAVRHERATETRASLDEAMADASASLRRCQLAAQNAMDSLTEHRSNRPGLFSWLFRTQAWKIWRGANADLTAFQRACQSRLQAAHATSRQAVNAGNTAREKLEEEARALAQAEAALEAVTRRIEQVRATAGSAVADEAYWSQDRESLHPSTPWLYRSLQFERDDVFVAAIEVHRAFIDAAAKPLRHNLASLMQIFLGKQLRTEHRALIPDFWASLFLLAPVISTTFASVERMLGDFPKDTIGWLLVDEAGQALPQAAVGALMRSRRALVVGDPLQIEPVVVLSNALTDAICLDFGVDPDIWGAPQASVQTVVDQASRFGTELVVGEGSIWIGMPLLVHRRCESPMFGISNQVAYSNLMVSATPERPSRIRELLGPSRWITVHGAATDKWCPEEGEAVLDLLRQIASAGVVEPDIYVISPFVVVAQRLRELLKKNEVLLSALTKEPRRWLYDRIGTVHTFQGKEAEAVVFVLGAPLPDQRGARSWAGRRPNLVNVAVSRAKSALYVVGHRELWRQHGFFGTVDRYLE